MTSDHLNDPNTEADSVVESKEKKVVEGGVPTEVPEGELSEEAKAELEAVVEEQTFWLTVLLPNNQGKLKTMVVHAHTTVQDVRQFVFDSPDAQFYTCFHFTFNGERVNELADLSEIEGFTPESQLQLVEEAYNDREVRVHITRLRELLTNFQPAVPTLGVDQAIAYLPAVGGNVDLLSGTPSPEKKKNGKKPNGKAKTDTSGQTAFQRYSFDPADHQSLSDLLPEADDRWEQCLLSMTLSTWNPPPYTRRMAGDLLYLTVQTLEKETVHITCSASGFYVNQSTATDFDPAPRPKSCHSHNLPTTLSRVSLLFATRFTRIHDAVGRRHPYEYIITSAPSYPWMVRPRDHHSDQGRTMDLLLNSMEALEGFSARDWNEDLQTARELPVTTPQERVARDSAIAKAHADFVEAATRGVVSIVGGSVPSMNPMDPISQQMYIHNNIFFSQQAPDQFEQVGGKAASHVAVSKDVDGAHLVANLEIEGLHTLGTAVIDYKGSRIVAQTIIPGIFRKIPGQDNSVLYGSVDSGKLVSSDKEFHNIARKIAKPLHLAEHGVVDDKGVEHKLITSVESKGIMGADGRRYLLDLYRVTPVDIVFQEEAEKEAETNPYPHKMTLLRPELVDYYYEHKLREYLKVEKAKLDAKKGSEKEEGRVEEEGQEGKEEEVKEEEVKEEEEEKADGEPSEEVAGKSELEAQVTKFQMVLNPDVFTPIKTTGSEEEIKAQEEAVREASSFLNSVSISRLVAEVLDNTGNTMLDGEALTSAFHRAGINMRYLGKVMKFLDEHAEFRADYFKALCIQEMVARSAKHILRELLEETPAYLVADCISHFLNCVFARPETTITYQCTSIHKKLAAKQPFATLTPTEVHSRIQKDAAKCFRYEIPADFYLQRRIPTLRSICLKVGIQILAKDYVWDGEKPIFAMEDIVNVYPVVKHGEPRAAFAEEAMDHGRVSLAQNQRETGIELLKEAASIYEQVLGPVHPDTARPYQTLAMLSHHEKDHESAKSWQRKALLVKERTSGFDNAETLQAYINLGYFEYLSGNAYLGLKYMHHALKLWEVSTAGGLHGDTASTYTNVGSVLQSLRDYEHSNRFYEKASELYGTLLGQENPMTIVSYDSLVKGYFLQQDFRKALAMQKTVWNYYKEHLGEDTERTKEAELALQALTQHALAQARREKQDAQDKVKKSSPKTKPVASGSTSPKPPVTEDERSLDSLLKFLGERPGGSGKGKKKGGK